MSSPTTEMPDNGCDLFVEAAIECGLCISNGMGITAITWSEIRAWSKITKRKSEWLLKIIKILSEAYVSEYYAAKAPGRVSPMLGYDDEDARRLEVASKFKTMFKGKGSAND